VTFTLEPFSLCVCLCDLFFIVLLLAFFCFAGAARQTADNFWW